MRTLRTILCGLACAGFAFAGELDWPAITSQTKPWARWWWLGNIGTKQDFTTQMERYAAAGLGGLELTPIYGVRGEESRFRNYLSPEWMDVFDHVLAEGKRLGLGIDMSTGNAWPFGGPWVTSDFSARRVVTKTYALKAGERLGEPVGATDEPLVRVAGPRQVSISELKDPVTSNANLQGLALDQVRFPRALPLQALVAYSDRGEKVDVTAKVGAGGRLDWIAPAGNWTLYAVFLGWHGKQVERAGPGGEGDVIDHFSADALAKYLKRFDEAYAGHNARGLRAYFNDSYEVDDAQGESNWTAHFFDEFKKRRGYDLRDELPAFLGQDTEEKNSRVISDHRETISDLLLENYTQPWAKWAAAHGALVRNQAHGSPANILDLYAASGIPETEGANVAGMKLASSAAHVTGKPLASSETATWLGEHWSSTLADIKQRVDLMFLGGVNQQCYHGMAFSPPNEPWPGFHFYASVELDPSNSIWADAPVLNAYVARCQSFLQSGHPANDILLYYSTYEAWAQRGEGAMPHFGGGPRGGGQGVVPELLARGYAFDYVSDRLLQGVKFSGGALQTGGVAYRAILVPDLKLMPLATLEKFVALAEAGATIVVQHNLPADVPGFGDLAARRAAFRKLLTRIGKTGADDADISAAAVGQGRFLFGGNLDRLLERANVGRETLVDRGLQFERRADAQGAIYFLLNRASSSFEGWLPLRTRGATAAIFDPMSGRRGVARTRATADGALEVYLRVAPGESRILRTFAARVDGPAYVDWDAAAEPALLDGAWTVKFVSGGPTLPAPAQMTAPGSWTELEGDATRSFSGTASYTTTFASATGAPVSLDLGRVADSARVRLNGREVAALIAAPWRVVLDGDAGLKAGENTLEILVTNLAANRVADLDRRDPSWKKFYNANYPARIAANRGADGNFSAAKWLPRPAGLLGPVTLTPVQPFAP
ncbi:MAG TPA: glycosyl hydrolase [Opitutaceae bacterium]|nr:glycosyl hydrolase [Opitutaceae bacterium]